MKRKIPLVNGEIYHILSRSIAEYKVFNSKEDYVRMMQMLQYYQFYQEYKFSYFIDLGSVAPYGFDNYLDKFVKSKEKIVEIVAYCLMPTHPHIILKQVKDDGISQYFGNILNSYTKYFNFKHKRKGPLWEARFNSILVENDEQLLHLTRYIHLNPATAHLVDKPEKWRYSSYKEYISSEKGICNYSNVLEINPRSYRKFVNDRISYQRELAKIKAIVLD